MGLIHHKDWGRLRHWLHIQVYDRDGGHSNPRVRIELKDAAPLEIKQLALAVVMPCVACGAAINPFRARCPPKRGEDVAQHIYFAAACPLGINIACSRGMAARNEYLEIRTSVGGRSDDD